MKKKRIISFVLCFSIVLSMLTGIRPMQWKELLQGAYAFESGEYEWNFSSESVSDDPTFIYAKWLPEAQKPKYIKATKTVVNSTSGLSVPNDCEFEIELYLVCDPNPIQIATKEVNANNNTAIFDSAEVFNMLELTDKDAGIYLFFLTESSSHENGIKWETDNDTVYLVTVDAVSDGQGGLIANEITYEFIPTAGSPVSCDEAEFINVYTSSVDIEIEASKVVSGGNGVPDTWSFDIGLFSYTSDENARNLSSIDTLIGTKKATEAVSTVKFITETYHAPTDSDPLYYVRQETSSSGNGWLVDEKIYLVRVDVDDIGNGMLEATTAYFVWDEAANEWLPYAGAEFENVYAVTPATWTPIATKNADSDMAAGQFEFTLFTSNGPDNAPKDWYYDENETDAPVGANDDSGATSSVTIVLNSIIHIQR